MTNEQMYLLLGVPLLFNKAFLTIINGNLNARMGAIELRMTALENRIEVWMSALEGTMITRFDLLMGRLADLEKEIHKR